MADRRCSKSGGFLRNAVFTCVILFTVFLPVAECNYEALYDYEREKYVDTFATYVVEDEVRRIELEQPIYFYGQKFSTLQVSKDGTVSFGEDVVTFKRNPQWPQGFTELTSSSDRPFIAAFHYDGYASPTPQTYHGRLYWSKYERQRDGEVTEDTKRHDAFLDYLGKYLSHSSVTVTSFQPHVYVMVTWENVTDHLTTRLRNITCSAEFNDPCRSATFQVVVAADFHNTFVIFNYAKMDLPYSSTHLMGMNGGRGRGWTDVVTCVGTCRKTKQYRLIPNLLPILQGSSSDDLSSGLPGSRPTSQEVLGRFIFVVTDDTIVRGGCLPHGIKGSGYLDTVEVAPDQVAMMGGDIIKVSGQCQPPYSTIYCRFDSKEVTEGKISAGMVGWCPVPRLERRGNVKLEVSSDPNAWRVFTHVIAIPPGLVERLSDRVDMQPWFQVDPTQLTVTWNSSQLSRDRSVTVDIVLVQYLESGDQVLWKDLVKLAENIPNSGSFYFNVDSEERFRCREFCDDIDLGLVEIRLTKDHLEAATEKQYIGVGPLPLAWYVNEKKTEELGKEWYQHQCERWAGRDREHAAWLEELPPCPCTLQQTLADWGRWQADVSCSMFNKNSKCPYHNGAKHCVRSVHPTSQAAGSLCCYDNNNNLMYAADSYEGSMSSKAHAWGAVPYGRPGHVPVWSHWLHDLIPYYQCCRWSDRDQYCQFYAQRRPTPDCRFYDPPGSAIIFGDPHVRTFDDEQYHFGGAGDFWLVHSPGLSLQARFLERQTSAVVHAENVLLPTYITSVALRGAEGSDIVTFTKAPPDDLHPRRMDVTVNRQHFFFDKPMYRWQDFTGLTIINNEMYATSANDRYHNNFTVLLHSGAGVQVAERQGLLNVVVLLPPLRRDDDGSVIRETASKGLLGSWDEKKVNEYMTPDGDYVPVTEEEYIIYKDFALKWAVEKAEETLFQFTHPITDRMPIFDSISSHLDLTLTPSEGEVMAVCGTTDVSNPCAYDYFVTGNRTVATSTKASMEAFDSLRRSEKKVWSCGWLPIPYAIKDHTNYSAGSSVRVIGCRPGRDSLSSVHGGPTDYICVQNETDHQPFWDPYDDINHYLCTDEAESASIGMIVGIAVAVVVVIAVIAVVAFIFYKRRTQTESVSKKRQDRRDEGTRNTDTDDKLLRGKRKDGDNYPMDERRTIEA